MKAAIYYAPGVFKIEDRPDPRITPYGVIVRNRIVGVCPIIDLPHWKNWEPMLIGNPDGHEWAAEVVEVGSKVTNFKVGDRIWSHGGAYPCFKCAQCQQGEYWRCTGDPDRPRGHMDFSDMGHFKEYSLLPFIEYDTHVTVKCPQTMGFQDVALVEPFYLSIGLANKVTPGDTVVIVGQHIVGLGVTARLKELGIAKKIITSSISKLHRDASKEAGADMVVDDVTQDLPRVVMQETNGEGAESVFICDHRPISYTNGLNCAAGLGKVWMANRPATGQMFPTSNPKPPIAVGQIARSNESSLINTDVVTLQNAWGSLGPYLPRMEVARDMIIDGKISAKKHVTHLFPLEKINEAFETAMNFHESLEVQIEI